MLRLRILHRYLGVFFIPAILFFAFSGALQTFGLHESKQRGEPPPVAWIATLASLHKDQRLPQAAPSRQPVAPIAPPTHAPAHEHPDPAPSGGSPLPLKIFTLLMAIGLMATSLLGAYLALSNPRTRASAAWTLLAGVLVPVLLTVLR